MINFPVNGTGFVIYDEPDGITGIPNNVPDFLNHIRKQYENGDAIEDFEVISDFENMELFDATDSTGKDCDNTCVFEDLAGNRIEPIRMLCIRHPKEPAMFDAPYISKNAFIEAVKQQLKKLELLELFPEDFNWENHIGNFRYVTTSI